MENIFLIADNEKKNQFAILNEPQAIKIQSSHSRRKSLSIIHKYSQTMTVKVLLTVCLFGLTEW